MAVVAVIGSSTLIGVAVLTRLQEDAAVDTILGIDLAEPDVVVGKLRFRVADVRERLLPEVLDGADVVVHCGLEPEPDRDEGSAFARTVHGTRNLLVAAAKIGVGKLVVVSSAVVYGAHPDNPLPLDERAALRADPDFAGSYHLKLAEQLVEEWADGHPGVTVTLLRPAVTLGHGSSGGGFLRRHLESPRLPRIGGQSAPLQFVHADDVASAVQLAVSADLPGAFNVAAQGWLPATEVSALLGRRSMAVPEATAFGAVRWLWQRGLWHLPPGALPYLMYPWVVSSERLQACGWAPTWSNRELLREFARQHHDEVSLGPIRMRRQDLHAPVLALAGVLLGLMAAKLQRAHRARGEELTS
ncbi:MAG: NAD-dependent epimerase/dehydratase family protein [Egibacteraceae bacterium]